MIQKEIIGACLVSVNAVETAVNMLSINDFSGENKKIFEVIKKMIASNTPVDIITVSNEFTDCEYLRSLYEDAVPFRNIKNHCEILISNNKKEALRKGLSDIVINSNNIHYEDILCKIEKLLSKDVKKYYNPEIRDLDVIPYKGIDTAINKFIPTGLDTIDNALNDLVGGYTTLVAGRENCGKTTFSCQIIANTIDKGFKTLVINGEEKQEVMINRIYNRIIGRDPNSYKVIQINKRTIKEPTNSALQKLQRWHEGKLRIFSKNESSLKNTDQLFSMIKAELKNSNHDLIVLDNLMSLLSSVSDLERNGKQSDFMQMCCDIAKEYNTHIIIILHPNKTYKKGDKELDVEQISGTSDLGNKADNIIAITREYDANEVQLGTDARISVIKNRAYSELPMIKVHLDKETGMFLEINEQTSECERYNFRWKEEDK
jgi:replicative DNA helicase